MLCLLGHNDQGNRAAARNLGFVTTRGPPRRLTALFGLIESFAASTLRYRAGFASLFLCRRIRLDSEEIHLRLAFRLVAHFDRIRKRPDDPSVVRGRSTAADGVGVSHRRSDGVIVPGLAAVVTA